MSQRVDFSPNAAVYDRRHGAIMPREVARELADRGCLPPGARILDAGAGTGRVALAFAELGYRIIALDPSVRMLNELHGKAPQSSIGLVAGEGARLPFAGMPFDVVILARVLYLMPDWEKVLRAVCGVLRPGGCLFHEWSNGHPDEAWVQVREKLCTLFHAAGVQSPFHPGARTEGDVDAALRRIGLLPQEGLLTGAGPWMTLRDFIVRIEAGEFSYTWNVPQEIQKSCLPALRSWADSNLDLDKIVPVPRELVWAVYRKPGGPFLQQ